MITLDYHVVINNYDEITLLEFLNNYVEVNELTDLNIETEHACIQFIMALLNYGNCDIEEEETKVGGIDELKLKIAAYLRYLHLKHNKDKC